MAKGKPRRSADPELYAINVILEALDGLDGESIQRVLDYVFGRLSIARSTRVVSPSSAQISVSSSPAEISQGTPPRVVSIRDLKEEKRPSSSNQMAALVAYYLSDVQNEQDWINAADLQKYFKQAGFKLPKSLPQALPNAAAAGYFDSLGDGRYRLNPVGYNLVVHGLPREQKEAPPARPRAKRKKN